MSSGKFRELKTYFAALPETLPPAEEEWGKW
jgi:hypothetical protein